MASRLYKLLALFLVAALTLYIVLLNRETIVIRLAPSWHVSALAGVIYLAVFAAGVVCATLVGVFFGIKSWLREQKLKSLDRQRREFYEGALAARSFTASAEWRKAAQIWESLIRKDPSDMIARVELSRCLEGAGEVREALKVLESARAVSPDNVEVLFRTAELHLALGNRTAAIDNLALILSTRPNRKAAVLARDLSEHLERYPDALEYQERLEALSSGQADLSAARACLEYKRLCAELGADSEALQRELQGLVRRYPRCAPALARLAGFEAARRETEKAAQLYIKAAHAAGDSYYWIEAARLWLEQNRPEKAIAAARSAARGASGRQRVQFELDLIRLYISLNMLDDAREALDGVEQLAAKEGAALEGGQRCTYLALRGLCMTRAGEHNKAAEALQKLCEADAA